jgi:YfiH family protein
MYFSKKLQKFANIKHCFFSRKGGISDGIYESLNCGLGSKDKKENVTKNLELVSKKINCNKDYLITLNQTHSNKVIFFNHKNEVKNKILGDAIVTKLQNIGIGILTADCAPILLYEPQKKIIACVHSGWKGSFNGIIENTIKKIKDLNSDINNLVAVVGPCIKQENYEVGVEFFNKFLKEDLNNEIFFNKVKKNKHLFDLRGFINKKLSNLGIKNIDNIDIDTYAKKESFYSYRRSKFNSEEDYGRCISVILMT